MMYKVLHVRVVKRHLGETKRYIKTRNIKHDKLTRKEKYLCFNSYYLRIICESILAFYIIENQVSSLTLCGRE